MLLIVSDPGARGVANHYPSSGKLQPSLGLEKEKIFIVFNRYKSVTAPIDFGIDTPIAIIPDDPLVEAADLAATPALSSPC